MQLDFEKMFEGLEDIIEVADTPSPIIHTIKTAYQSGAVSPGNPCTDCRTKTENVSRMHFHGSEFNACSRRVYLDITSPQTEVGFHTSSQAFLLDGHTHEMILLRAIEKGIKELGLPYIVELAKNKSQLRYNITKDIEIIGHYDGLLHDQATQTSYVLECKAVKENTWREVMEGKISEVWYGQMQFYMFHTECRQAILCVKNRETSNAQFKLFEYDEEFCFERMRKLIDVYNRIRGDKDGMPDRERNRRNHKECKFCPHFQECWEE